MSSCDTEIKFCIDHWITQQLELVEQALADAIQDNVSPQLAQAMRYGVLDGGKRLRPLLVLAAAQAVGANGNRASINAACAVELIHAYSLIHDDMPCMDNDVLRRGKPTVHVKYGQGIAMLAGDALQALAFEVLTAKNDAQVDYATQAKLVYLLARGAGTAGMAGGQAIDLLSVGKLIDEAQLRKMHTYKTGALLEACIAMGVTCASTEIEENAYQCLMRYAACIGLAFQVVDDVLDVTANSDAIGKTAGKDACAGKPTYVSVLGLDAAQNLAQELYREALYAIENSGLTDVLPLKELTHKLILRSN